MQRLPSPRLLQVLVIASCLHAVGCGGSPAPEAVGTGGPTAKEALTELARLLEDFKNQKKRMPTQLAQIEPVDPVYPGAYLGLLHGNIAYAWGASLNPSASDKVIAYEKVRDTEKVWVLMQDGTLQEMTPGELKAAPKAN